MCKKYAVVCKNKIDLICTKYAQKCFNKQNYMHKICHYIDFNMQTCKICKICQKVHAYKCTKICLKYAKNVQNMRKSM